MNKRQMSFADRMRQKFMQDSPIHDRTDSEYKPNLKETEKLQQELNHLNKLNKNNNNVFKTISSNNSNSNSLISGVDKDDLISVETKSGAEGFHLIFQIIVL